MAFERDVRVNVVGDSSSLERTFARSTAASKKFGREFDGRLGKVDKGLQRLGAGRAALIGGLAGGGAGIIAPQVIDQLKAMINVASNLNEQISKSRVVFGASSAAIEDWSKTTATGIGLARDQAVEAASTFGAMFRQAGQAGGDAANLSKAVVQLAGDLASFNNTSVDDALTALRSGLSGEIEPLRRFQVFLTEAAVQQRAMEQTGKANAKQLTQGEKILARYSLIMEQTTKAQGDFQRTSSGLANQQRILAARTRDLQGNLGKLLLPTMTELTGVLVDATGGAQELASALQRLGSIKIPPIHIPFVFDLPGGSVGGAAGSFRKFALAFQFTGVGGLWFQIGKQIAKQFDDAGKDPGAVTALANDFARSINTFTQNALDLSSRNVKAPALTPAIQFDRLPGVKVDFASSILGPLDKAIAFAKQQAADAISKGRKAISKAAAEKAREDQRTAFQDLIDALSLKVDRAAATKGIRDDLAANTALQHAIQSQIKVEGRTTDLARQLFEARQARADILAGKATDAAAAAKRANEAAAAERQARQFKALGLTGTGEEPVPGVANLAKRLKSVLGRISSGDLDVSSKLVSRLKASRRLIKAEGGKLTEDTRNVINDFLKAASGQDATKTGGPLTKGSAINAGKILEGLLLPPGIEATLRARLSKLNSVAGIASPGRVPRNGSTFTQPSVVVESHTTVQMDRDVVARAITRSQQKTRRRNPPQKRGPSQ